MGMIIHSTHEQRHITPRIDSVVYRVFVVMLLFPVALLNYLVPDDFGDEILRHGRPP